MNERVQVYIDHAGKWRWRWWRGSDITGDSSQGYKQKRDCLLSLTGNTRATYEVTFENRRTPNRRAYQQGHLRWGVGVDDVFVEVTPWTLEEDFKIERMNT